MTDNDLLHDDGKRARCSARPYTNRYATHNVMHAQNASYPFLFCFFFFLSLRLFIPGWFGVIIFHTVPTHTVTRIAYINHFLTSNAGNISVLERRVLATN